MALILLLLIGAVLGFGFKVRILIPATFLTIVLTCAVEILHEQGSVSTALITTAAVIAIQMGYLIGVVARMGTDRGVTVDQKPVEKRQHGFHDWFNSFVRL